MDGEEIQVGKYVTFINGVLNLFNNERQLECILFSSCPRFKCGLTEFIDQLTGTGNNMKTPEHRWHSLSGFLPKNVML